MIIVSDTTPLHYLILIERAQLLADLFNSIIIPESVFAELSHEKTPARVQQWIADVPAWVEIKRASAANTEVAKNLGRGEAEAINLALEEKADALLMDDRKAIREARKNNLTVITTLGVLELASIKSLIDFPAVLNELAQTSFRLPPDEIMAELLNRYKIRKQTLPET